MVSNSSLSGRTSLCLSQNTTKVYLSSVSSSSLTGLVCVCLSLVVCVSLSPHTQLMHWFFFFFFVCVMCVLAVVVSSKTQENIIHKYKMCLHELLCLLCLCEWRGAIEEKLSTWISSLSVCVCFYAITMTHRYRTHSGRWISCQP